MTKSYFSTGRYVILDSGFCILKGFIQLRKKGIVSCDFINNRRYSNSMVPGKETKDHFGEVEVGEIYAIQGTADDVIYNLCGMKEPNYVMRMMANGVQLLADDISKDIARRCKENG